MERLDAAEAALQRQLEVGVARLEAKLDRVASSHREALPSPAAPASSSLQNSEQMPGMGEVFQEKGRGLKLSSPSEGQVQQEQDRQRALSMERRLDQIASAVGVRAVAGEEDDHRKRLKEKLNLAIERDKRSRIRQIVPEHAKWLEHIFGICKADQRLGKRGSRLLVMLDFAAQVAKGFAPADSGYFDRLIHPNSRFVKGVICSISSI